MNAKSLIVAFFFYLLFCSSFSQTTSNLSYKVQGHVIDSVTTETIPYTTVSVYETANPNIYVKRIASGVKGEFELNLNKIGNYILSFESVGMKRKLCNIAILPKQNIVDMKDIKMISSDKMLKEITVIAAKPLVKVDLDKISYDTKSDPESQSTNVLEILKKVPLVTVDGDDKIQLKGSSDFKVYINGKASGMVTRNPSLILKSMPASSIKNIEVITEPGAKYDAEGIGGIINIVTDHSIKGLTGSVRTKVNSKGGYGGGLYLSTKTGKFGLTTNLNYLNDRDPNSSTVSEKENLNSQTTKYISKNTLTNSNDQFYYGNIEASYEFDSLNLVSFAIGGYTGNGSSHDLSQTYSMDVNRNNISAFKQQINNNFSVGGIDLSLDYQHTFRKPEQLLTLSYKLSQTPNSNDSYSELSGLMNYSSYNQHIQTDAEGNEHTFQVDYTEPFNKMNVVEFGAKYIIRLNSSVNTYLFQEDSTQAWKPMSNQSNNNLNQTQNILGAYGSYTLKLEKFSIRTGLRFENTGSNIVLTDTNFHLNFFNLVPAITLSYKFSEYSNLKLSYNQRISRPGIYYLNPFLDNSNPNSLNQGNPDLKPEVDNSFTLNYSLVIPKITVNSSLFASFTNNSIESISKSINDSVIYSTYKNIGYSRNTGLSVYGNWQPCNSVRINLNGNFGYRLLATNDGSELNSKGFEYNFRVGSQITLPFEIKWNMIAGYYSPRNFIQGDISGELKYSTSFSRDFFNKKINLSLRASNFMYEKLEYKRFTYTQDYTSNSKTSIIGRSFGLTVSYKFGKLDDRIKKVERTITNDDVKGGGGQNGGGGQ